jgi:hypothetical protein
MQHVKKRSCSRATHGGFLRPAREKIRHAEIAEKIWKKKPSLKDALVYWKKIRGLMLTSGLCEANPRNRYDSRARRLGVAQNA